MFAELYLCLWLAQLATCAPLASKSLAISQPSQSVTSQASSKKYIVDNFNNNKLTPYTQLIVGGQGIIAGYDTGSEVTWFPQPGTLVQRLSVMLGLVNDNLGSSQFAYHPEKSKTARRYWLSPFYTSYGDGASAAGVYCEDTLLLGIGKTDAQKRAATVNKFIFGVATTTSAKDGVIGLGPSSSTQKGLGETLVSQGLIEKNAFGFHMNSQRGTSSGQVVFGGVDRNRFTGPLRLYKAQKDPAGFLQIPLLGLSVNGKSESFTKTYLALIDSGAARIYLPSSFASKFQLQEKDGIYYGACDGSGLKDLTFNFGSLSITVPLEQLYLEPNHPTTGMCPFLIAFQDDELTLGVPFMRAAYVYYDNANYKIGIAQQISASPQVSENIVILNSKQAAGLEIVVGTGKS